MDGELFAWLSFEAAHCPCCIAAPCSGPGPKPRGLFPVVAANITICTPLANSMVGCPCKDSPGRRKPDAMPMRTRIFIAASLTAPEEKRIKKAQAHQLVFRWTLHALQALEESWASTERNSMHGGID